ncbi:GNAT family N-acetyltransferase [Candidatus Bathyarchaeota archaeon]|nr:GNAT family N-acetyltransferase [Candidatus Bathyarchaeota archaeon]
MTLPHIFRAMKTGEVIREFIAKDGRRVILRTLKWEDLDDLLDYINSLVEEGANIIRTEKVSRMEEIEWLSRVLATQEKGEIFTVAAEVDGHLVANSEIMRRPGYSRHVGVIGIAIKKGFRGVGIGTEMMKALEEHARKVGLKVLTLSVFASNQTAMNLYRKMGFVETGRIPKKFFKDGDYIDEILMTKILE